MGLDREVKVAHWRNASSLAVSGSTTAGIGLDRGPARGSRGLARAIAEDRVVVTENAADFVPLLEERSAAGLPLTAVVVALKRSLPRGPGAMNRALADGLATWAESHPDPYRHVHWLS